MSQIRVDKKGISDLWILFIDGDTDAFSEIYRTSYKMLYSYGISFKITEEQVRDIIQDLFVKLYTRPDMVKDPTTLRPFLFTAMRNSCINSIKVNQKHTKIEKVEDFDMAFSVNENIIEDKEEQLRVSTLVQRILAGLTVRQREIIYLRFLHQMDYEEISKIMNMTEQAARNLTYRAMDKIRKENSDCHYCLFFILLTYCCY
ncbi:MAG: sigma-70 family RNA polymerase sigma factor [Prevotella sp.]|jgi:RNA polymerase sigma factor (sigma-70 family)|nr:sigma-70 family RNA polymerase sigma factor [Prevotella sp.]